MTKKSSKLILFQGRHDTYIQKVQGIQAANQILYHPMNEPSGGVANDYSPENNDGAYTGVTLGQSGIGDGNTSPLFDGANDFNNIYSAGLVADFNGAEGTAFVWIKVSAVGVWTDAAWRNLVTLFSGGTNRVVIQKGGGNNECYCVYHAGGENKSVHITGLTTTDWFTLAITWSASADKARVYLNGLQTGSTLDTLGTWSGALAATDTCIGSQSVTPTQSWDGWLAHGAVWKIALTPAEILRVATL